MDKFRCHFSPVYCSSREALLCGCLHRGTLATCTLEGPKSMDAETRNLEVDLKRKQYLGSSLRDPKIMRMGAAIGASQISPSLMQRRDIYHIENICWYVLFLPLNVHSVSPWKACFQWLHSHTGPIIFRALKLFASSCDWLDQSPICYKKTAPVSWFKDSRNQKLLLHKGVQCLEKPAELIFRGRERKKRKIHSEQWQFPTPPHNLLFLHLVIFLLFLISTVITFLHHSC